MVKKKVVIAQLDILNSYKGHDPEVITINDDDPARRAKLAQKVTALIRDGFLVALADGQKIKGYDPKTNEWLVGAHKSLLRVHAKDKSATAVGPSAGG